MAQIGVDDLFLPCAAQQAAMEEGRFTSQDLTRAYLDRIIAHDGDLHAFVQVDAQGALAAAAAADARRTAGERTPTLGLCVGVKDLIDVAGLRTTYGSAAFADHTADRDAPAVRRLREAGSVILGKVNTTEFALLSANTIAGRSRNPWDAKRTAGGSSNGSGTATSAGLCSFAIGTDTAGSIRSPASFMGLVGLKPTHGRVPAQGIGELSTYMDTVGPFGRTVADVASALQVMAGYEPDDITSADRPVPDYAAAMAQDVEGLVVGAPADYMAGALDPQIRDAWLETLGRLGEAGATVAPVVLPDMDEAMAIWRGLVVGDALLWHEAPLRSRGGLYSKSSRGLLEASATVPAVEVARARKAAWALRRRLVAAIAGVDTLVLPGAPVIAPRDDEVEANIVTSGGRSVPFEAVLGYALPFNVTGLPAMVTPVGLSASEAMPMAVMVCAAPFGEDRMLRAAAAIEGVMLFETRPAPYR